MKKVLLDFLGWVLAVIVVIALICVVVGIETTVFMLLWNWIVGGLIGWITLSFWQSLGVILLLDILGGLLFRKNG
jgi:hypothetical protein